MHTLTRRGFPVDSFPDGTFRAHESTRGGYVGNLPMHRSFTARFVATASLLAACVTLGGCASILPIAGAIVLKEAADRYEKSEAHSTRRAQSTTVVRSEGVQAGDSPELEAPEGSTAAKAASVPTSVATAEQSATESSARILATAIKRIPKAEPRPAAD